MLVVKLRQRDEIPTYGPGTRTAGGWSGKPQLRSLAQPQLAVKPHGGEILGRNDAASGAIRLATPAHQPNLSFIRFMLMIASV